MNRGILTSISFVIVYLLSIIIYGCGPGIPLNTAGSLTIVKEDLGKVTISLSLPSLQYVKSQTSQSQYILVLSHPFSTELTLSHFQIITTGTAKAQYTLTGSDLEYILTFHHFEGEGTVAFNLQIDDYRYNYEDYQIVVDNTPPSKVSSITLPGSSITQNKTTISWSQVDDLGKVNYHVQLCDDSDCLLNCTTEQITAKLTIRLRELETGVYYACVKTVDLAGNSLGYQSSQTQLSVSLLSLSSTQITLSSPSSGTTSSDNSPLITGENLTPGATLYLYSDSSCTTSLANGLIDSEGSVEINSITLGSDGPVLFYGKVKQSDLETACIDLEKEYSLLMSAPDVNGFSSWALSSPSNGLTSSDRTPVMSGNGPNGAHLTLFDDNICTLEVGSGSVTNGSFSINNISYNLTIDDGLQHFYFIASDDLNNQSECSDTHLSYLLDTVTPNNPSGWTLDNITNGTTSEESTPTISGVGLNSEVGGMASIYSESNCTLLLSQATITAGGVFSITGIAFQNDGSDDGLKSFYGKVQDVAGNESSCTNLNLSYILDSITPNDPTGWSLSSPLSGVTSNDATPVISGGGLTSENGSSVSIYGDSGCSSLLGTTSISGGSFSVNSISFLSNGSLDGTKEFYGKMVDSAGHASSCVDLNLSYYFDTIAPNDPSGLTMSSPSSGTTSNDRTPQITLTGVVGENGSTLIIYDHLACLVERGSAVIAGGTATINNISYAVNGSDDGTKIFYGRIVDIAGNSSDCVDLSLSYLLDTTPPASPSGWTLSSPVNGVTSEDVTPQISGSGLTNDNGHEVTLYESASCSSSIGSVTIALNGFTVSNITFIDNGSDDGVKSFYGIITDDSGNSTPCTNLSLSYRLDTTPPSNPTGWTLTSPVSGTTTNDRTPVISGTGINDENGSEVTLYDDGACLTPLATETISGGAFTINSISYLNDGSDEGSKNFYGKIVDTVLNESACVSLNLTYLLDTVSPADPSGWTMSSPSNGVTSSDTTPQISGGGLNSENGGTVSLFTASGCGTQLGSALISAGSFTVSNINYANDGTQDGLKDLYGKVTDVAGNESSCTQLSLGYKLDTTTPVNPTGWTMSSPVSGVTSNDFTPQIGGTGLAAEEGSTATIFGESGCTVPIGSAVIAGGSFTVSNITFSNDGSVDGTKSFYGKIVDEANHESACTQLSLGYKLDTTAPSSPTGWSLSSPISGVTSSDVTPVISGGGLAVENGGSAYVYDSALCTTAIGSSVISAGSFNVNNITYLSNGTDDGSKTFYGKIVDIGGNESSCVNLSLGYNVDTTVPLDPVGWTFVTPTNGTTSGVFTPQISGSGLSIENGSSVNIYLSTPCTVSVGSAVIAGGVFTVNNISFENDGSADGIKQFYGKITDRANHVSECVDLSLSYQLNSTIPSVDITVPLSSAFIHNSNKGSFTVSGNCSENGRVVTVSATGGLSASPTCTALSWTTNLNFSAVGDGAITITADHSNAGLVAAEQAVVILNKDATLPSDPTGWTLSSPASGSTSKDVTPTVGGVGLAAENGALIEVYSAGACLTPIGTATVAGGTFSVNNIVLASDGSADGTTAFYGKIIDTAGNSSACVDLSLDYLLDTTTPSNPASWTMSSPNSGTTSSDGTPEISKSGLASENGATITIYDASGCSSSVGSATIAGGSFTVSDISYLLNGTEEGTKAFYGKVTDVAGNSSSCIALNLGYLLDTVAPANPSGWSMSSPSSGITSSDTSPQMTGTGLASVNGGSVALYDAVGCVASIGTATISGGGFTINNISYAGDGSADGVKSFYGKVIDAAGNESSCISVSLGYNLDTTLPSNPSGWSLSSPNSGTTSNDYTPQISKSGLATENGSVITLYDSGVCSVSIGSAVVAGGSFTVSNITYASNGTQDGTKSFYGKMVDVANNSSDCVDLSLSYKLDTISPSNPSGWTQSNPNSGTTSNDNTPQISGTGLALENGGTATLYDSAGCGSGIGSATIAGGGFTVSNISYLTNGTQDGTKPFYGKITDTAGNHSSCISLSLGYLLDTTAPSNPSGWTMSSPSNGATSTDGTPQIAGSGLSSENGETISIYDDGGVCAVPIGTAVIASGSFTVSNISYAVNGTEDGGKILYGKITDIGGNSSSCVSLSLSYLLDTTAPSNPSGFTLASPNNGVTSNDVTPQISGSGLNGENGSGVSIYSAVECSSAIGSATIAGGSFTVSNISYLSNGTQDGSKTFYGKIVDAANNSSSCVSLNLGYKVDTVTPSAPSGWSMSSPSSGTTSNDVTPQISKSGFSGEDGTTATIYGVAGCGAGSIGSAVISGGSFTISNISYPSNGSVDGTKTFYGILTDAGGNATACTALSLGYLLDTTAPSDPSGWTISSPANGSTSSDSTPQIAGSGLASENGSAVNVYKTGACGSSVGSAVISGGTFTVSNISLTSSEGTNHFWGKITDTGGNSSACTDLSLEYYLDTSTPSNPSGWTMGSPSSGTTSKDYTPQISGSGIVDSGAPLSVSIYDSAGCGSAAIGTASVNAGSFTVSDISYASNGSNDGAKAFYGKVTDGAGNSSSCTNLSLNYYLLVRFHLTAGVDSFTGDGTIDEFDSTTGTYSTNDTLTGNGETDVLYFRGDFSSQVSLQSNIASIERVVLEESGYNYNIALTNPSSALTSIEGTAITGGTVTLDASLYTTALTMSGGSQGDSLTGSKGADTISGNSGSDTLIGRYGGDILSGGDGDDILYPDSTAFSTATASGLQLWLDSSSENAIAQSGGAVSQINDLSGYSKHATQSTAGYKPLIVKNIIAGRSVLRFDGTDDALVVPTIDLSSTSKVSLFMAMRNNSATLANTEARAMYEFTTNYTTSTGGFIFAMYRNDAGGIYGFHAGTLATGSNNKNYNVMLTTPAIAKVIYDKTQNGTNEIIDVINGNIATHQANTVDNGGTFANAASYIGTRGTLGSGYYNGDIAEILLYNNSLTSTQNDFISEYLSFKYAQVLNGLSFGVDSLTGGTGADRFAWTNASHSGTGAGNRDTITDFSQADGDKIDLTGLEDIFRVIKTSAFSSTGVTELRWMDDGSGNTVVQIDWGGNGTSDFEIKLNSFNVANLVSTDFLFKNAVTANAGDTLTLSYTGDSYTGGTGNDTFNASTGSYSTSDTINGGAGTDQLVFNGNYSSLTTVGSNITSIETILLQDSGSNYNLFINNPTGLITIDGSAVGGETITIDASQNNTALSITGGSGNDSLTGGKNSDIIGGGLGNDTLIGRFGGDTISGGDGNDSLYNDGQTLDLLSLTGNLQLWLDSHDYDGDGDYLNNISNGGYIPTWTDKSGLGNHAVQSTVSLQPNYLTVGPAGRSSLTFGSSDYMTIPDNDALDLTGDYSMYSVVKTAGANVHHHIVTHYTGSPSAGWGTLASYGSAKKFALASLPSYTWSTISTNLVADGNTNIAGLISSSGSTTGYVNGNTELTLTGGTILAANEAIYIGANVAGSNNLVGDFDELLIFDVALSTANRLLVEEYLSYKWGRSMGGISLGVDTLTGGTGADSFFWNNASYSGAGAGSRDIVTDFNQGENDKIDLSGFEDKIYVLWTSSFSGYGRTELRWADAGGGNSVIQIDWNGDAISDFEIQLNSFTYTNLTYSDFILNRAVLAGVRNNNTLAGGSGNDTIIGGYGSDTISGGGGDDLIYPDSEGYTKDVTPGLQLWLDSQNSYSLYQTSGVISTWEDQSGNLKHAVQSTSANRPTLLSNGINNYTTVSFDGTNDGMDIPTIDLSNTDKISLFTVGKNSSASIGTNLKNLTFYNFTNQTQSNNAMTLSFYREDAKSINGAYFFQKLTTNNDKYQTSIITTPTLFSSIVNRSAAAASEVSFELNEVTAGSQANAGDNSGNFTNAISTIGYIQSSGDYLTGQIAEVMLFDINLSSGRKKMINDYLSQKYGIALNGLSFGHDDLTGGSGADHFIWTMGAHSGIGAGNRDIITDFNQGESDKIDLSDYSKTFQFRSAGNGSSDFTGSVRQLAYSIDSGNNRTIIYVDSDGDNTTEMEIELTGLITLSSSDFIFSEGYHPPALAGYIYGGNDDDTFYAGTGEYNIYDQVQGGGGNDTLILDGDYSGGVNLWTNINSVENLVLADSGYDYDVTIWTLISAMPQLSIDGSGLSGESLTIDAFQSTTPFTMDGGDSGDYLIGGLNGDTLSGGDGSDSLVGRFGSDTINGESGDDVLYPDGEAFRPVANSTFGDSLQLWLDANDYDADENHTNNSSNGSAVSFWYDKSGLNNNAAQTNSSYQPTYLPAGTNGRGSLNFVANAHMIVPDTSSLDLTGDFSLFSVVKTSGANLHHQIITHYDVAAPGNGWGIAASVSSTKLMHLHTNAVSWTAASTSQVASGSSVLASMIRTSGTAVGYVNGNSEVTLTGRTSVASTNSTYIGANYVGGHTLTGEFSELLIFDSALSAINRQLVDEYLAYKYGMATQGMSLGFDTLTGGSGADHFVWTNASYSGTTAGSRDRVTDFSQADGDKIDLTGFNDLFNVIGTASFSSLGKTELRWMNSSGNTIIQIDWTGNGTSDFEIQLDSFNYLNLSGDNFLFKRAYGSSASDTIRAGDEGAYLVGGYGGDSLTGGGGNDRLLPDGRSFSNKTTPTSYLWFDAGDANNTGAVKLNGIAITTWFNQVDNGINLTQSTAASKPTHNNVTTGLAPHTTLTFDGGDWLSSTSTINIAKMGTFSTVTSGVTSTTLVYELGPVAGTYNGFNLASSGGATNFFINSGGTSYYKAPVSWLYNYGSTGAITSHVFNGTNATHEIYFNGSAPTLTNPLAGNPGTTAITDTLYVGARAGSSYFMTGELSELIVLNNYPSVALRKQIEEYLSLKYGMALSGLSLGVDTLTGGSGTDLFTWTNASFTGVGSSYRDVVTDFSQADKDKIVLEMPSGFYFRSGGNGTADFTGTVRQVAYYKDTGNNRTIVYIDRTGDALVDQEIELTGLVTLTANDFIPYPHQNSLTAWFDPAFAAGSGPFATGCMDGLLQAQNLAYQEMFNSASLISGSGFTGCDGVSSGWGGSGLFNSADPYVLNFDGANDVVRGEIPFSTAFSFEMWVYPDTRISFNQSVDFGNYGAAYGWGMFGWHTTATGGMYVGTTSNDTTGRFTATEIPADTLITGQWHHFVFTYDGTTGKFYKNGVQIGGDKSLTAPATYSSFRLASINGKVGLVRIYSKSLTIQEIKNNCLAEEMRFTSNAQGICPAP